jgi:ketosteroid isomerase-like protein
MSMNDIERAAIERECTRLITQYAYLNDERRFDELAQLFTEDAVLYRPSAPDQAIVGRPTILEAFKKRPADTATFHICSDMLIDVQDSHSATARSRILMLSTTLKDGAPGEAKTPVPGTFRDRLVLTKDGWKFAERRGSFWVRS